MTPLDLALSYASAGIPVFPCRAADEDTDEFDPVTGEVIVLKPKTPLTVDGFKAATRSKPLVKRFWAKFPEAMVGAPSGEPMKAWILDIDVKKLDDGTTINGFETLSAMEEDNDVLDTAMATTPRGGRHYYFAYDERVTNRRGNLGQGVDVRGNGGFVCLPGSVMADGGRYEWLDYDGEGLPPLRPAPKWLLDIILPPPTPHRQPYTYQANNDNEPYVTAAVEAELSNLAAAPQGGRGEALNRAAFSLGTLVGADVLSRHEAEDGLYAAAASNGVLAKDGEKSTLARIKRGLDAGSRQPRAVPERQGDDTPIVGLGRLVKKAKPAPVSEKPIQTSDSEPVANLEHVSAQPSEPPAFTATPYTFKDPRSLPRREFAFGTHYIRKYVSVTVSPGGLGKTSNSIVEAASMVSGRDLTGIKPPARLKVWLFNAEDPRDEMERRIQAVCLHYKLKPTDINGHLFLDTGREQDLVIAVDDKRTGTKIQVPIVEAVVDQIRRNQIDVMIVDPFVSTHQVNENDNGAIDKVAKLWAQIADDTNCSIDIVHHLRKVADREATVEDARGAVSLIGAARSVRVLNRMSEEQATASGVPVQERFSYFNIHQGKANLTKMSTSQDWRRLESVPLGNGTTWKPQDFAGVVTEWKWPSPEEAVGEVTGDQLEQIKSRISNTDCKLHAAADNWVGREVAYVLGLDIAIKADKARVARLVKAWIEDGTLLIVNRRCPIKRENKDFVEVAELS
ncbi:MULTISPECIES: AAA family ATPase [unclassified Mesorhizobium]|uniref:AAA family ATPase n=1 Tax=unclassified Mesorhizobium TaxID=325217 RepID=UPI001127A3DC|nr:MULTISPECIES: AAA family ATPase [unclassified Mesorhizobium]TPJ86939.1 ATPase [Mesorhizobium sp. B2-5-12]TPK19162.1 ATPase [Mesorhizobium sp. B2-5-6]